MGATILKCQGVFSIPTFTPHHLGFLVRMSLLRMAFDLFPPVWPFNPPYVLRETVFGEIVLEVATPPLTTDDAPPVEAAHEPPE